MSHCVLNANVLCAELPSVTSKPDVSTTVSTSFYTFFTVPVIFAIVILLIVLICWCTIKRDRVDLRARLSRPSQPIKRQQPQQQKQQQQHLRKFIVASNSRSPPSATVVNLLVSGPAEMAVGYVSDCARSSTDLERNPLQEFADKPAKITAVRFTGRFVEKLIAALSGQPRRQLDQTSTCVDAHRIETSIVSDIQSS